MTSSTTTTTSTSLNLNLNLSQALRVLHGCILELTSEVECIVTQTDSKSKDRLKQLIAEIDDIENQMEVVAAVATRQSEAEADDEDEYDYEDDDYEDDYEDDDTPCCHAPELSSCPDCDPDAWTVQPPPTQPPPTLGRTVSEISVDGDRWD